MSGGDTIYALSSGAGRSALAVVRVSGIKARDIVLALSDSGLPKARELSLRTLRIPGSGERLDEAVVVWLPGPRSYTGEDCAEFHVHGSEAVLSGLFGVLRGCEGVRLAEAGEFTRRAVSNGKMDLVEAEGLGDLLQARTSAQRRQALGQMLGMSSSVFDSWRERLLFIRADIEAVVDFVDEEGVAVQAGQRVDSQISELLDELVAALSRERAASAIRSGVKIVLAGLPNTGKSSLLNAIARRDAALVSAIPGTTRDVIEVSLDLEGMPVVLTDTAGLREGSADEIEMAGIARAWREVGEADITMWVVAPDITGSEIVPAGVVPDLLVVNKSDVASMDLGLRRNDEKTGPVCSVSAKTGRGLDALLAAMSRLVAMRFGQLEEAVVVTGRQREILEQSIRLLNESLALDASVLELKAEGVRRAADTIGRLTGRTGVEEWLGVIFSRFCIGK